jgi:molybdate transport system ATP-binding protein
VDNVAFGPRCQGVDRHTARERARKWLERVDLAGLESVRPARLSGGQAQRVALARALAVEPQLLLLDEPLAALDASTRQELRADLRRHLAGPDRATVLVTHDPLDAMVLADRIVVIEGGRVVQEGTATEITRFPRTDYVARLVGLNLYRGVAAGHVVTVERDVELAAVESVDGEAFVAFAPAAVALHRTRPDGSPRNTWEATVAGLERHGDMVRVRLDGPLTAAADVTSAAVAELRLEPGARVWAAVKATETHAYRR